MTNIQFTIATEVGKLDCELNQMEHTIKIQGEQYNLSESESEILINCLFGFEHLQDFARDMELENIKEFVEIIVSKLGISDEDMFGNINKIIRENVINEGDLNEMNNCINSIFRTLASAKKNNQTALVQDCHREIVKIMSRMRAVQSFAELKYIKFSKLQDLRKKTRNSTIHLKLLKDFKFIIPTMVNCKTKIISNIKEDGVEYYNPQEMLDRARKSGAFANFLIVHYDLRNKEEQDKNKDRDPIIFGILHGEINDKNSFVNENNIIESAKLIYITDYIDPNCNLTIEQLGLVANCVGVDYSTMTGDNKSLFIKNEVAESYHALIKNFDINEMQKKEIEKVCQEYAILPQTFVNKIKGFFNKKSNNKIRFPVL